MRKENYVAMGIVLVVILLILFVIGTNHISYKVPESIVSSGRIYECDYKSLNINTKITFKKDGVEHEITGRVFTLVTDPLTLTKNGKVIGKADDSYNFLNQDDHAITINGNFEVAVRGNFKVFGNSYDLFDSNNKKVGYAEFNDLCTDGAIYNAQGEAIAVYSKSWLLNDYTVKIYNNDIASDEALLMIVASYVSDYHYDAN